MKIIFTKALVLVAVSTFTFSANAQNDYVITVKGDSIPCKINKPFMGSYKYKTDAMSDAEKIKPDVIKEYYVARKDFRERAVFNDSTASPVFMTVVEKGKISLFEVIRTYYNGMSTTSTTTWFVSKNSDYVSELKTNALFGATSRQSREDKLGQMLMDNKEVHEKYIADDKFSFRQIRNLVHLYNTGEPLKN